MNEKNESREMRDEGRTSRIICGDCLAVLPTLPKAAMVFADPPDNIGCRYEGSEDHWSSDSEYIDWLQSLVFLGCDYSPIFWLSYNARWQMGLYSQASGIPIESVMNAAVHLAIYVQPAQ
jgi:DNA modification methylase